DNSSSRLLDGCEHAKEVDRLTHVVDTDEGGAGAVGGGDSGEGADGAGRSGGAAGEVADEGFPGSADEQRADGGQLVEMGQERQVVGERLAEADAGIEDDLFRGNAARNRGRVEAAQLARHVGDDVVVVNVLLHRPRLTAHVHEYDRNAVACSERAHFRI